MTHRACHNNRNVICLALAAGVDRRVPYVGAATRLGSLTERWLIYPNSLIRRIANWRFAGALYWMPTNLRVITFTGTSGSGID